MAIPSFKLPLKFYIPRRLPQTFRPSQEMGMVTELIDATTGLLTNGTGNGTATSNGTEEEEVVVNPRCAKGLNTDSFEI